MFKNSIYLKIKQNETSIYFLQNTTKNENID